MTLKEFKAKHSDVILNEVKWAELDKLASGAALFYVSLAGKKPQKDERTILYAGHILTAGIYNPPNPQLTFMRLTTNGNAKLDSITADDLRTDGRAVLFRTAPIADTDPRSRNPWNQWD